MPLQVALPADEMDEGVEQPLTSCAKCHFQYNPAEAVSHTMGSLVLKFGRNVAAADPDEAGMQPQAMCLDCIRNTMLSELVVDA